MKRERGLEWVTVIAIVVLIGMLAAGLSILRDHDARFALIEDALGRIETTQRRCE